MPEHIKVQIVDPFETETNVELNFLNQFLNRCSSVLFDHNAQVCVLIGFIPRPVVKNFQSLCKEEKQ